MQHAAVEALIVPILTRPDETPLNDCTIQGLGMLRYRLNSNLRLHIWHSDIKTPDIENSAKHTHAWDFNSYIFAGQLENTIYEKAMTGKWYDHPRYWEQQIECGADGCTMGDPTEVALYDASSGIFRAGDQYFEFGDQIHQTVWQDTTVTLIYREKKKSGKDIANIYIPVDNGYVAAPAIQASVEQRRKYCDLAMGRIYDECIHWGRV
jgi:hypothetical protein